MVAIASKISGRRFQLSSSFRSAVTSRRLTFKEVKAHTIFFLLELEKKEKITRNDGFQGVLNAIAGDVRSKHRKRIQRQQEMESVQSVLKELAARKKYFEEQINSYHDYVDAAMNTMQRGNAYARSSSQCASN